MFLATTDYRSALETEEMNTKRWLECGLGHPTFPANPCAVVARRETGFVKGSNRYATEMPKALVETVQKFMAEQFLVRLNPDQIRVSTSGTRSVPGYLTLLYRALHNRPMLWLGENVGYPGHRIVIETYGGIHRFAPPGAEFIDVVEQMERDKTLEAFDAIIFQAVTNPTAKITSAATVERIARLANRTGKLIYFDGAYQCVTANGPVPSPLRGIDQPNSNIIWSYSTSKGDQFADLGYGLVLGDPAWVSMFSTVQGATREGASLASYAALQACLENPWFFKQTSNDYRKLAGYFGDALGKAGISVPQWEGSIFTYFPIPQTWVDAGKTSFDYALAMGLRGVLLYPDMMFNGPGTHIRANLCKELRDTKIRKRLSNAVAEVNALY